MTVPGRVLKQKAQGTACSRRDTFALSGHNTTKHSVFAEKSQLWLKMMRTQSCLDKVSAS